jgi:hypothetical protein
MNMSRAHNRHSRPYRLRQIRDDYCTERRIPHHSLNTSTAHLHISTDTPIFKISVNSASQSTSTSCLRYASVSCQHTFLCKQNGRSDVSRLRLPDHSITHAHIMFHLRDALALFHMSKTSIFFLSASHTFSGRYEDSQTTEIKCPNGKNQNRGDDT